MIKLVNRLGAQKVLPVTFSLTQIPLDIQVPYQPLYGRHGAVQTGKATMSPRQFAIQGTIIHRSKANTRQELDALLPFLMEPPLEVYRHHEDTRFLRAHPVGTPQDWLTGDAEVRLRVPMIALDPYWYGPEVTVQVSGTQTVEVDGSAPVSPFVRTTGSVAGLTLINNTNSNELIVSGPGVIEVDNEDFTCRINGENRLDAVNPEWLILGFSLLPGSNQLETSATIEIVYRPRWY